jgi:glycerol-3-phosphate dehydrogenase (NAD(P)+)
MPLNVGLLGGGSWGTTVASLVARNAPITLWARDAATVDEINTHHTNEKYLPGASLPKKVRATADIAEAVANVDVLIMAIPSQSFRIHLQVV